MTLLTCSFPARSRLVIDVALMVADLISGFGATSAPPLMPAAFSAGSSLIIILTSHDALCASPYLAPRLTTALLLLRAAAPFASRVLWETTGRWVWFNLDPWPWGDVAQSVIMALLLRRLWRREAAARARHHVLWSCARAKASRIKDL